MAHGKFAWVRPYGLVLCLACTLLGAAPPLRAQTLSAADYLDEQRLADLLWQRSPELLTARANVGTAQADVQRSRLYPNPNLDAQWATVPLGRTNPPDLGNRFGNVPNYTAGLSELIEIGKRGPRQAAATADLERAHAEAIAAFADRFFSVLERVAEMAMNQERSSVLNDQIADSQELITLNRARAERGEIAPLDVDVVEVEHARLVAARDAALSDMAMAQADCANLLATACPLFESGDTARVFLEHGVEAPLPEQWSTSAEEQRPDLRALSAAAQSAEQRVTLAKRRVLPDPTLRLGYTYDEFVRSGNQRNSMALGVQLPLPVFDRGQADLSAALSEQQRAQTTRAALLSAAPEVLNAALRRRALMQERIRNLDAALDRAHSVTGALGEAQRAGGTSLIEVLVARRAYQDLLRERIDLEAAQFDAVLAVRRTLARFPDPSIHEGVLKP